MEVERYYLHVYKNLLKAVVGFPSLVGEEQGTNSSTHSYVTSPEGETRSYYTDEGSAEGIIRREQHMHGDVINVHLLHVSPQGFILRNAVA